MDMNVLSKRFRIFAERECKGSNNLYEHLAGNIANDQELLKLAANSKQGQPIPNLFLGAVHYLLQGDGVSLLPKIVSNASRDSTVCIFHTHVANQIPVDAKEKLIEQVQNSGEERDVFHLYNNMWDLNLHLDYFTNGNEYSETLAETDGHGRWFDWKL